MAKTHIVTGLDIGNSAVKTVVLEAGLSLERPQVIGIGFQPSSGLRRGMVVDMEETIKNIKSSLSQAKQSSGFPIDRVYVNISGPYIRTQVSRGVIAVSRADGEITDVDMGRVIEAASAISLPPNREILHIIPRRFIVDGQEYIKSPIGMNGVRLEADVLIIDVLTPFIKNLAKCINANDVEITEFVFSPLASSLAVLNKKVKEHGVMCFDFGGGLCNLAVFEEGELIYTSVLPIGSKHITNDLAIALRTSLDTAEEVKLEYGFIDIDDIKNKKDTLDLSELIGEDNFVIPKKQISEVINARVSEILDMASKELKKINRFSLLPGGITLIGGGAKLPGFVELVKNELKLPVRLDTPKELDGIVNRIDDSSFVTAVGLALWGIEKEEVSSGKNIYGGLPSGKALKKIRGWFKNFVP